MSAVIETGEDTLAVDEDQDALDALDAVARFGEAFDSQDVDAVLAAMTEDCVFESTAPPDGMQAVGKAAVAAAFAEFFAASAGARFDTEDQFATADRVVVCWRYTWPGGPAGPGGAGSTGEPEGHVRGIDVFRVRNGLISEKRSYVKG